MTQQAFAQPSCAITAILPDRHDDLARLRQLAQHTPPIVAVTGKYNHGKSRLLNELLGKDLFAVADRRETVALSQAEHAQARWLDAPGLDADVARTDDDHARQATWVLADIRLFVHAAKAGELDGQERDLLQALLADAQQTRRQTVFALTQIDQLGEDAERHAIESALRAQMPQLAIHGVSATRHRQGIERDKPLLQARSGLPELRQTLEQALAGVPQARRHEVSTRCQALRTALQDTLAQQSAQHSHLLHTQAQQQQAFSDGLHAVIANAATGITELLDSLGADHASVPDQARDAYVLTAGKAERNRIQIAYSRACIQIDSFLAGHGVLELPPARKTFAPSLNTVMIAVLGVSVKGRHQLRRMFCEAAGRERLHRDFSAYFPVSDDQQALAARIAAASEAAVTTRRALAELDQLEAAACPAM